MCSLVTTVHDPLTMNWACNRSDGAINKSPTVLKWSTFVMDCFRKKFGVKPYMIKKMPEAIMNVIKNLEREEM